MSQQNTRWRAVDRHRTSGPKKKLSIGLGFWGGATVVAAPSTAAGLAPGDVGVLIVAGLGLLATSARTRRQAARRCRVLVLPLLAIAAGTAISLIAIGLPGWALNAILIDMYLLEFGFLAFAALSSPRISTDHVAYGLLPGLAYTVAVGVLQGHAKLEGLYPHPNLNAHAIVTLGLCVAMLTSQRNLRMAVGAGVLVGVVGSASFGAMISGACGAFILVVRSQRGGRRLVLAMGFLVVLLVAAGPARSLAERYSDSQRSETELTSRRLDRTSGVRLEIWSESLDLFSQEPLGVGPHGVYQHLGVEAHSDYVAYVVERGPLGLIGLVALLVALINLGRREPAILGMVAMIAIAGGFRETLHFRHLWFGLAVALAVSARSSAARIQPSRRAHRPGRVSRAELVPRPRTE